MGIKFSLESDIQHKIEPCRKELLKNLAGLLPSAKIEEIGSTAIPGAITKGDLDVLVVVSEHAFSEAETKLKGLYERNDMEPMEFFTSFKGRSREVDFGVQLSTSGFQGFNFVAFRDALLESPELVKKYNKLKTEAAELSMTEYRKKKYKFIESVLSGNNLASTGH